MKKLFSILSLLVLAIASSVVLVACGDDYKNMYLEVEYVLWSNNDNEGSSSQWTKVDTEKGLDFVLNENSLKTDGSGKPYYSLRIRVNVKGTKKDVDYISVSCTGSPSLQLEKKTVSSGEAFEIKVWTTGSANLSFTPSIKSDKKAITFPINLYAELGGIAQNDTYTPAVVKGGTLELNKLTDLIVYSGKNEMTTNQLGVVYSIDEVDGVTLETDNNVNRLTVSREFSGDTINLTATSVYFEDISCNVTIKVVDNIDQSSFLANYKSNMTGSSENDKQNKITQMELYPKLATYNSSNIILSGLFNSNSIYNFDSEEIETRVFVDGKDVTGSVSAYNGLVISKPESKATQQQWVVSAETYMKTDSNIVEFVVGFKNYKFTGTKDYNIDTSVLRYSFEVKRQELPRFIRINEEAYVDKDSLSMNIYNNYENKSGLQLTINSGTKTNDTTKIVMKAYTSNDKKYDESKTALNVYSHNGQQLGSAGAGVVLNNVSNTIYLKYGSGTCPEIAYIDFEVLATPAYFEGQETKESDRKYITVTLTLNTIGKIDTVSSSSNADATINNLFDDKNLTQTIQADKSVEMYVRLSNSQGTTVTYSGTKISSNNDDILLSSDNINFKKEIDCGTLVNKKLYIKGATGKSGQLTITTPLGLQVVSRKISFVSVTTDELPRFAIKTNDSNVVSLGSVSDYDDAGNQANFYAMQFNSSADFVVAYGDSANKFVGISKLSVVSLSTKAGISQYGADVFKTTMLNSYSFNLQAISANLTSALKVTIKYNTGSNYSITENTTVLYLEIASFIPVSNIQLSVSNSEVYYVNSLITDKATSEITLSFNSNASTYLSFSDKDIENSVNSSLNSKIKSLYYVSVSNENTGAQMGIESLYLYNGTYLDMESNTYGFRLTKSLDNINAINVVFTLRYYGLGISKTVTATIRVVDFKNSTGIELRGLNKNNNINLSLQSDARRSGEFSAYVSNTDATYKLLDYQLYELDQDNADGDYLGDRIISDSVLRVEYSSQQFKLKATGETGGKFVLRVVAVDSYSDTQKDYTIFEYVVVNISDGELGNPFYLYDSDDVKNITNAMSKHYVLANNIDLSGLEESIKGEFTGSINGIMTSYDASNGVTVMYTQSLFKNLNINNTDLLSLFEKNSGTLQNLVMSNVKFNININIGAGNDDINIGALVGENAGTIINCSAIINVEGTINIAATNSTTSAKAYNVGALIGKNTGNVYYFDQQHSDLKQYSNYRQMAEFNQKLTVTLNSVGSTTAINIGGAIGDNTGIVVGNYSDFNQDETEYLTSYTDIDFVAISTITTTYQANIGGFAGSNNGMVKNVAIKGSITGAGNNLNLGGIVGNNTSKTTIDENGNENGGIINSATFSCEIIGRPYNDGNIDQTEITNQNVGGAVGLNSGDITTVYVLFVQNSRNSNKFGLVKGVDCVGGLVGQMADGAITVGNVQGFVDNACVVGNFASNKADVKKSVAGLVGYTAGGEIRSSYAKVNISTDSGSVSTLANGSVEIKNSFFVGSIADVDNLANLTINSNDSTYSLAKGYKLGDKTYGKLFYNGEVKAYYYYDEAQEKELWTTSEPTIADGEVNLVDPTEIADFAIPNWTESNGWTDEYKKYNSGLPVIVYKSEPTLLALATDLIANVADDYFKTGTETTENETKVYTHNNGIFFTNGTTSTAIVFLNYKTFNLVKKNADGLVDISVLPNIASKSYYVEVVSGGDLISLVGNFITFKKAGRVELEFVSTFNPNALDRVVIFAVEPIDSFEVVGGNNISMTSNSSKILSLVAKYGDITSQLLNNYLYVGYSNEDSSITVTPLGNETTIGETTYYAMDDIQLEVKDFEGNGKNSEITIDCYLELSKFVYTLAGEGVDQKTLQDLFNYQYKIASQTLSVTLYQKASSIVSNLTDTKVATSQSVDIEVEVITGYVDKNDTEAIASYAIDGQYLTTTLENKENLQIKLSTDQDLSSYNLSSVWDMFNVSIIYQLNSSNTGYLFNINIELKDKYKDIVDERTFVFEFAPKTNTILHKDIRVSFEPQSITTLRIENFKSGVATLTGTSNVEVEYTSSETQSSIIVPGKSGLAKIYVEPTFARVDELVISSSSVTINGQTYTIYFQQMLYDQKKECYVSYQGYTSGSNSLRLVKNTYIDENGTMHYTGVVYVRTILENAVALDETFTLTVVATEYKRDENGTMTNEIKTQKTATKMLVTQFNPGVYVSSNGTPKKVGADDVYLIEKSSNSYEVSARIVGYKTNQNPELKLEWKNTNETDISKYVSYSQSVIQQQSNGDYLVTWRLTTKDLKAPIVASVSISVVNEDMLTDTLTKEITLYPVDYIPTEVLLSGTANDVFRVGINSSKSLDIVWKNKDGELDSEQINTSLANYISYFYRTTYNSFGQQTYESWKSDTYKNSEGTSDSYKLETKDNKLYVTGLGEDYVTIVFGVKYGFEYSDADDKFEIKFVTLNSETTGTILQYTFKLDLRVETTEEEPEPIYTATDLAQMTEGGNYILMNDLTLEDWVPLTAQIASLDGNSKRIFIKSFSVATASEISAGLFASLGENCIIKNLTIDLRDFAGNVDDNGNYIVNLADDNAQTSTTYFGFIAGQNAGLIYNSELINTSQNEKKINIKTKSDYSYIGGLVGQNTGNITNSRVGTPYYLALSVDSNGNVTKTGTTQTKDISLNSNGIMGGLAATNSGIISSSYFQNANLVNLSTEMSDDTNKTAGFVAVNTGKIYNSYTKSRGRTSSQVRGQETKISSKGTAAGFVFENNGIIENSYSNIFVTSSASAVAGFVYRNNSGASINRCYSASAVLSTMSKTGGATATSLAFVGVGLEGTELNKLLSFGELNNCYYLEIDGDNFDYNYESTGMDVPIPLDDTNFADSENLNNFAFVNGNYERATQGVWTYYANLDSNDTTSSLGKTFLPELTSANQISRSIRYLVSKDNDKNQFAYGKGYALGTADNPYIIRNYIEYNNIFSIKTSADANVISGSIRLINDIDFAKDDGTTETVNTTQGYDLGDLKNNTITVFDGNGMTISSVDIKNYETAELKTLGLFGNIYNTIVKSLNVNYVAMDYTSTKAMYSGGLAGTISNSSIVDVTIKGNSTTITAQNFAGGIAGYVTGDSILYNVSADVNVTAVKKAQSTSNQYLSETRFKKMTTLGNNYEEYLKTLSYAGGIAGVIDVNEYKNFTNINQLVVGENGNVQVTADIAGFVAGYLGPQVTAKRLKSFVGADSYVFGAYIAGGLIGENYANISFSQVSAATSEQESIDSAFASYILADKTTPTSTSIPSNSNFGNLSFVRSTTDANNTNNMAGGFIGVNYNGTIQNSYSKTSISANASYIGGFVGTTLGGGYETCYSQTYFDIQDKDKQQYIGGMIGYNKVSGDDMLSKYIIDSNKICKVDNFVAISFYDKSQLEVEYNAANKKTIDYMVGHSEKGIASTKNDNAKSIYTYYLSYSNLSSESYFNKVIKIQTDDKYLSTESRDISALFDLTHEKQLETFENLFMNFDDDIWEKDNKKFTPTLRDNPDLNFYQIKSESDLELIRQHPNGNFEVMGNISLSNDYYEDYVLNIEFTGTMRGKLDSQGNLPKISNIKIKSTGDTTRPGAGFFKATTGANISNIDFEYQSMSLTHDKTYVGLLSSDEKGSEVTGVNISCGESSAINGSSVQQFGGLFGDSDATICTSCSVDLSGCNFGVEGPVTNDKSAFGGLTGYAKGESTANVNSMFMNCTFTKNLGSISVTGFEYVGGLAGYAENSNINTSTAKLLIAGDVNSNKYVGGAVGYQHNAYLSTLDIYANINSSNPDAYIGGISGYVKNDSKEKSADISNSSARLILTHIGVVNAYVGGIAGETLSTAKIENVVSYISGSMSTNSAYFGGLVGQVGSGANLLVVNNAYAYAEGEKSNTGFKITAKNIMAGGLIGCINSNNCVISIDMAVANGGVWASKDAQKTGKLHLGGLIGAWGISKVDLQKSITFENGDILTSHISNVYTTFALEYSQYKLNNGNTLNSTFATDFAVSGIVGKLPISSDKLNESKKLSVSNVIYSSDYVLAVEEKDVFSGTINNVVADVLLRDTTQDEYFDNSWTKGIGHLPYISSLSDLMKKVDVLDKFDKFKDAGTQMAPKSITTDQTINTESYTYYLIEGKNTKSSYVDSTQQTTYCDEINLTGELNGFILGNGKTIATSEAGIIVGKSSVVSNLNIQLNNNKFTDSTGSGVVATTNNGTIFNCQVDFYFALDKDNSSNASGGGIAGVNEGNILYCYSTGSIENAGTINFSGIAKDNSGFIYSSGAVGILTGGSSSDSAGLVSNNSGTVYNCFSAVSVSTSKQDSTPISLFKENTGYVVNCYYDMYANNEDVTLKDGDNKILAKALSTKELQTGYSSKLLGNWTNYPMCSITQNETDENNETPSYTQTKLNYFNYGYPIYVIEQTWYDSTSNDNKLRLDSKKGIWTGDGTEANPYLIVNAGTLESINMFTDTSDIHFRLICDIAFDSQKGVGIMKNWVGIGQGSNSGDYFQNGLTGNFAGYFAGGDRFKADWIKSSLSSTEDTDGKVPMRQIKNLNGNSLFNTILGANIQGIEFVTDDEKAKVATGGILVSSIEGVVTISNINFEGTFNLTNSGANGLVAGRLKSKATLTNIEMKEVVCLTQDSFGGLIGEVEGNLIAQNITMEKGQYAFKQDSNKLSNVPANVGGLIGKLTSGSVSVTSSKLTNVQIVGQNNVGGLVGVMTSGNLTITSTGITAEFGTTSAGAMGGLVGTMENGNITINESTSTATLSNESAQSSGFGFEFGIELAGGDRVATYTGGVVGHMVQGYINGNGESVTVSQIRADKSSGYAGGVIGYMEAGTVVGVSAIVGDDDTDVDYASGFGGVVGYIKSGNIGCTTDSADNAQTDVVAMEISTSGSITLDASKQVGGIAGVADGGTFGNIVLSISTLASGGQSSSESDGLGGLIGVVNGAITLGNVTVEGMNILSDGKLSNVGGLFGVLKTNSINELADAEISISGLTVIGTNNVGGFAGQYINDSYLVLGTQLSKLLGEEETENDKAKATGESGANAFASVVGPRNKTTSQDAMNFGGLFGYYCSGTLGYAKIDGTTTDNTTNDENKEQQKIYPFVNRNSVLAEKSDSEWKGVEIKNVGGIAGLTQSINILGKNEGSVGSLDISNPASAKNEEIGKTKTIYLQNVGGIVGTFKAGTTSSDNLTFKEVSNTGTVKGYESVGGLMGSFSYDKSVHEFEGENEIGGTITGVNNVGGYFGYLAATLKMETKEKTAESSKTDEEISISVNATVEGRINVGGYIGKVENKKVIISNVKTNIGQLTGVVNVGGYIGLVNETKAEIYVTKPKPEEDSATETDIPTTQAIGGGTTNENDGASGSGGSGDSGNETGNESSATTNTTIKIAGNTNVGGIVGNAFVGDSNKKVLIQYVDNVKIDIEATDYNYGTKNQEDIFYMPTSIGGLVGSAQNVTIQDVAMTKDTISITRGENVETTPSSVGNYILSTPKSAEFEFDTDEDFKEFDDMETGIGGLIGTLDDYYAGNEGEFGVTLQDISIASNVVVENGINVGGLVGCLSYSPTLFNTLNTITVGGSEENPVYVAGALGVGGMFGKIKNDTKDIIASYDSFEHKTTIKIEFGYLNIQAKEENSTDSTNENTTTITPVHGEYVGAFAGVSSSIYEIQLDTKDSAKVTIYNDEGGYYGGIVGKLNGSLGRIASDNSETSADKSSVSDNITFNQTSTYNYGGLVGLVDATNSDVVVLGEHTKAFTVDSVRVSAGTSGENAHVDETQRQILLYANKTINHNVTISKTLMYCTDKYGGMGDRKKYTFKDGSFEYGSWSIWWDRRSHPITNTLTGWDEEYTMFRTMELTEKTNNSYSMNNGKTVTSTIYDAANITKVVHSTTDGKILYTIYNNNDYPILYSRLGVATFFTSDEDLASYQASQYSLANFDDVAGTVNCNVLKPEDLRYISSKEAENNTELKETGQKDGAFYNFESEKVLQQLLKNEETNWEKVKNNFQLDFYYINVGGAYYKFNIIFADSTQNRYEIDGGSKNGIATGSWDPRLMSADRTYSLFDIVDKTNHQVEYVVNAKNYTWVVVVSSLLGGWIGAAISLIIIYSTGNGAFGMYGWSAKSIWFTVLMSTGGLFAAGIFGIVGAIFGWFNNLQSGQISALKYITSNYVGEYGLVSPDMVQPWYFSNGVLVCESDESIVMNIDVTNGTIAGTNSTNIKQIMYLYTSTSRPAKYGEIITIQEGAIPDEKTGKTDLPETNDKMPQYVYKNGKYYICMYGLTTSKRYVTNNSNLELPGNVNWWYQNEDGSYYVASDLVTKFSGSEGEDLLKSEFGIIKGNIITSKYETKTLHFGKLIRFSANIDGLEGYDYITKTFDDLCEMSGWQLVDNVNEGDVSFTVFKGRTNLIDVSQNHNDAFFETNKYYLNGYIASGIFSNSVGYETYQTGVEKDVYDQYVEYKKNNAATEDVSVIQKYIKFCGAGGQTLNEIFDEYIGEGDNVRKSQIAIHKEAYNQNYADGDGRLYLAASTSGIEQTATYYFYNGGLGEQLFTKGDSQDNIPDGVNTTYPLRETSSNPVLYKKDGSTASLTSIIKQTDLANYYIQPVYEDQYKATNYYAVGKDCHEGTRSDGEKYTFGTWYEYDTSYILENVGTDSNPIYALTKVSVVDTSGNYIENKFAWRLNGATIYTHYQFNDIGKIQTALEEAGLLPNSNSSGYVGKNEYYFNELILFSGRTYDNDHKFKGGISMYDQKSSS